MFDGAMIVGVDPTKSYGENTKSQDFIDFAIKTH